MKWTTEKPTRDGWYWAKCHTYLGGPWKAWPVKIYNNGNTVLWGEEHIVGNSPCFTAWSDQPIPEPT